MDIHPAFSVRIIFTQTAKLLPMSVMSLIRCSGFGQNVSLKCPLIETINSMLWLKSTFQV